MVAVNQITTYKVGNTFWADATEVVDVSASSAWKSLDQLLMRIIEIPSVGANSVEVVRVNKDVPMIYVGNKLVAKAAMLGGIFKASMSMQVTASNPPHHLRLAIRTFNMHFADVEFRIEPVESGCKLTYRQGFRTKQRLSRSMGENMETKRPEMPETARIFNLWVEMTHAAPRGAP